MTKYGRTHRAGSSAVLMLVAFAATSWIFVEGAASEGDQSGGRPMRRIERAVRPIVKRGSVIAKLRRYGTFSHSYRFADGWKASCEFEEASGVENCAVPLLLEVPVRTPRSASNVRIIFSVTMNHVISRGDAAHVSAAARRRGSSDHIILGPGSFEIASATSARSTSTLSWTKRLPARGRRYAIGLAVNPKDRSGNGDVVVAGTKMIVTMERSL